VHKASYRYEYLDGTNHCFSVDFCRHFLGICNNTVNIDLLRVWYWNFKGISTFYSILTFSWWWEESLASVCICTSPVISIELDFNPSSLRCTEDKCFQWNKGCILCVASFWEASLWGAANESFPKKRYISRECFAIPSSWCRPCFLLLFLL